MIDSLGTIQLIIVLPLLWVVFRKIPQWAMIIVLISVNLICLYEIWEGLFQLFGLHKSNHFLYSMTGSFDNPGPLGGMLSICISLLGAYCYQYKCGLLSYDNQILKTLFGLSLFTSSLAIIVLPSTQSRSAILALVCSFLLFTFSSSTIINKLKPYLKQYGLLFIIGFLIVGISAYLYKKPSADGRLFIDKICIKTICANGLKGAGRGHFGGAYGETQALFFKQQIDEKGKDDMDWRVINTHDRLTADCPDNAFNEFLLMGVEFGPIVMFICIAAIIFTTIISFKRGTIWCYGLTTLSVFSFFSYPLHIKTFQFILVFLFAACLFDKSTLTNKEYENVLRQSIKKKNLLWEVSIVLLAVISSIAILIKTTPDIKLKNQVEAKWKKLDNWHKKEYYFYVVENSEELLPYMRYNHHFLFVYGQSLNKIGEFEKSDSILKLGTEISSDPMFWNVMGNNSFALGRYREAEERYKHAFYMVPNRLYPLYLLAKLYYEEGDTSRLLGMAKEINSFRPKVESDITDQLRLEINELVNEIE